MFQAFRNRYGFTYYGDNRTPVTWDIHMIAVVYISVLFSISMLIATLGIRGVERWYYAIRASYAVTIGSIILVSLIGQDWVQGSVDIQSNYVYKNSRPFIGSLHLKVGLYSANITLDGYYDSAFGRGYTFYCERLPWPDNGHEQEAFDSYLTKGMPEPILKVVEFITFDKGGLRWGRAFHKSGYFAGILLWASFSFWIVSNVLLCSVVLYGAYLFLLTGMTMILACVTYHVCQCPLPLVIMFNDNRLQVCYGWCFWLTLAAGCMTCLLAVLLIAADHMVHEKVSEFFQLEKLVDEDFFDNEHLQIPNGSIVPGSPSAERGGSIFLATCRLPRAIKYNSKGGFLSAESAIFSNSGDSLAGTSINQAYSQGDQKKVPGRTGHRNSVTFKLQYVDEDGELCLRDIEASMYTLPEDVTDNSEAVSTTDSVNGDPQSHGDIEDTEDPGDDKQYKINITPEELSEVCAGIQGKRWNDGIYQLPTEEFVMTDISGTVPSGDLNQEEQCEVYLTPEGSSEAPSVDRLQVPGKWSLGARADIVDERTAGKRRGSDGKRRTRFQDRRFSTNLATISSKD